MTLDTFLETYCYNHGYGSFKTNEAWCELAQKHLSQHDLMVFRDYLKDTGVTGWKKDYSRLPDIPYDVYYF